MIDSFISFLPAAVCLFWILFYIFTVPRIHAFKPLVFLLLFSALYLLADSCYTSPHSTTQILTLSSLVSQLAAPCILPLLMIYLYSVRTEAPLKSSQMLWVVIPAVMFTLELGIIILAGFENIEGFLGDLYSQGFYPTIGRRGFILRAYYWCSIVLFRVVILVELLIFLSFYIPFYKRKKFHVSHLRDFLKNDRRINIVELMLYMMFILAFSALLKVAFFRNVLLAHRWIAMMLSCLLTITIFLICFVAQFSAKESIKLKEMINGFRYNYSSETKDEVVEEMISDLVEEAEEEALRRIQEKIGRNIDIEEISAAPNIPEKSLATGLFTAVADSWDEDSLTAKFQHLMMQEQLFLQPGLTLADVAERLGTNKTYISRLVNNTYNLAFPDLINTLRIDYAEQYIIKHRGAKQADIAAACGFTSASTMNITFKKITGMTPKIWLATYDQQNMTQSNE